MSCRTRLHLGDASICRELARRNDVVFGKGGEAVGDDLNADGASRGNDVDGGLASGSVLTSRLPSLLPFRVESKMTAALMMGLPLNFFGTVTSMREVAGGALYLRPCLTGASWASTRDGGEDGEAEDEE